MDDRERYAQGLATRRAVLGDAHVDRALAQTTAGGEAFQDLLTRYVWGEIWTRPGLDVRSRRLLVLATLIATGRWDEFRLHAGAALREGGFTMQELTEIVLQQAVYCGVPTARHAIGVLAELEESPTQTEE